MEIFESTINIKRSYANIFIYPEPINMLILDINASNTVTIILDSRFSAIRRIIATMVITSNAKMNMSVGVSEIFRYATQVDTVRTVDIPDINKV